MTFPTIHLNGTNGDDLISSLCDAMGAINEAVGRLAAAAPNGRDYYVQPAGAFQVAQDEHFSRMERLLDVRKELSLIVENICEQQSAREAIKRGAR